jgi:hypothetical protein
VSELLGILTPLSLLVAVRLVVVPCIVRAIWPNNGKEILARIDINKTLSVFTNLIFIKREFKFNVAY